MPERNAVVAVMALISDQKTQSRSFSARESTCSRCLSLPKDPHTDEHVGGDRMKYCGRAGAFGGRLLGVRNSDQRSLRFRASAQCLWRAAPWLEWIVGAT